MNTTLLHLWERLRTSFWFVPGIIVLGFTLIGFLSLEMDDRWGGALLDAMPALSKVSPEGIRSLLSTAATSVLALAGVTFSGTLVALTLASSQFGSRLLRNFIRALPNQVALGMQMGTFVICLVVLRSVRDFDDGTFVPHFSAFLAFLGTMGSLGAFIFFIHHVSTSLQAEKIVGSVYEELDEAITRHFPEGRATDQEEDDAEKERECWEESPNEAVINSTKTGYLQAIDTSGLAALTQAEGEGVHCRVLAHAGKFVTECTPLIAINSNLPDEPEPWSDCFIIGMERTPEQDFEHCIRQLVETGLRALSPGINDPFTAMHCIDYLGAALAKVAGRRLPLNQFDDDEGVSRVQIRPFSFDSLLATAFHQLRQIAFDKPDISIRLLEALANIARCGGSEEIRKAIQTHVELVGGILENDNLVELDKECIKERIERVHVLLDTA